MPTFRQKGVDFLKELERAEKTGELEPLYQLFETNEYGAYKFKSRNKDTDGLKVFKSTKMKPVEKFLWYTNKLELEKTSVPGWLKFYYNNTLIFFHERELYILLDALALGITPYYWGAFGIGKTFKVNRLLKKLFERVHSIRLFKNTTPEDLFGSVDALSVYTISSVLKDILIGYNINQSVLKEVVDELAKDTILLESYLENNKNITNEAKNMLREQYIAMKLNTILGRQMSAQDILEISNQLNDKLRILKLSSFHFAEIGKALEENTALLIDEIDKVSEKDLNYISQIVQPRDRAIQIVGFGTFEFIQPTITLGNKENISQFIKSRVKTVQAMVLPEKLLKELFMSENITDPEVINALLKLAPKLETGELSIRDLINDGLMAQQLKILKNTSNLPFTTDPVEVIMSEMTPTE